MEEHEQEYICDHLPDLIRLTRCSELLFAKLECEGVLGSADIQYVKSLATDDERVAELFRLLQTRTGAYSIIEALLQEEGQTGAAEILRQKPGYFRSNLRVRFAKIPEWFTKFMEKSEITGITKILVVQTIDHELTIMKVKGSSVFLTEQSFEHHISEIKASSHNLKMVHSESAPILVLTPGASNLTSKLVSSCAQILDKLIFVTTDAKSELLVGESELQKCSIEYEEDTYEWDDLHENSQTELIKRRKVRLQETHDCVSLEYLLKDEMDCLGSFLRNKLLVDLIRDRVPILIPTRLPANVPFYISRKLVSRSAVSKDIFRSAANTKDIFVVDNMQRHELTSLVGRDGGGTDTTMNHLRQSSSKKRFLLLSKKTDFQKVASVAGPVATHWLHFEKKTGELTWVKSSGNLALVQKHILSQKEQSESVESDLFEKLLNTEEGLAQNAIFADKPGMGKSELLVKFGHEVINSVRRQMSDNKKPAMIPICIHITLSELIGKIRTDLKFKCESEESEDLPERVLELIIPHRSQLLIRKLISRFWRLELLVDGFDEIHDSDLALTEMCLKAISGTLPNTRIVVTTRSHLLPRLEAVLGVLGHTLNPFSKSDQVQFLSKFWSRSYLCTFQNEVDHQRLSEFTQKILTNLHKAMSEKDNEIAGVPLQCLLLAEVFEEDALEYLNPDNILDPHLLQQELAITSITKLYGRLIDRKFELYIERHKPSNFDRDSLLQAHARKAFSILFDGDNEDEESSDDDEEDYYTDEEDIDLSSGRCKTDTFSKSKFSFEDESDEVGDDELLKIGLLLSPHHLSTLSSLTFIHRTFAEYLVAWQALQWLRQDAQLVKQKSELLFNTILKTVKIKLVGINDGYSVTHTFKHWSICYFLDSLIENIVVPQETALVEESFQLAEACAVNDAHTIYATFCRPNLDANCDVEKLVILSILWGSLPLFEMISEDFKKVTGKSLLDIEFFLYTPEIVRWRLTWREVKDEKPSSRHSGKGNLLFLAARRGEYSIVEYLLNSKGFLEQVISGSVSQLGHYMVQCTTGRSEAEVGGVVEILRYLVNFNPGILREKYFSGATPLFCWEVHVKLLLEMLELGADPFSTPGDKESFIQRTSRFLRPSDFYLLMTSLPPSITIQELVKAGGNRVEDLVRDLVNNFHLSRDKSAELRKVLEFLTQECHTDFSKGSEYCKDVLFVIIERRITTDILSYLIDKNGVDWRGTNFEGDTLLHYAARRSLDTETLEVVLDLGFDVNITRERDKSTALHQAASVEDNVDNIFFLLEHGADIRSLDAKGRTPLHYAAEGCTSDNLKVLIQNGAEINVADNEGNTPMHYCAANKFGSCAEILTALVNAGGALDAENCQRERPLNVAKKSGNVKAVEYLERKGSFRESKLI